MIYTTGCSCTSLPLSLHLPPLHPHPHHSNPSRSQSPQPPAAHPLTHTLSAQHLPNTRRLSTTEPSVTLEFGGSRGALSLGHVTFATKARRESLGMGSWVRKTSLFSGSLSRKFRASDGEEYRWVYRGVEGHEWTVRICISFLFPSPSPPFLSPSSFTVPVLNASTNVLWHTQLLTAQSTQIAHYTLKHPSKPAYGTSGNVLVVCEARGGIVVEVLASLIVMRCIAAYNL
ncbi:hypothetical protein BC629DRAFT_1177680 [Irpex lacteus]|nr:hypothetical protein BC629DRAFT_1177680 [Irpex lacteus]